MLGLCCCAQAFSSCGVQASHYRGFSHSSADFSSWGTGTELLRGMWNLPRPGTEPISPTLAGGFLTTGPPGKSYFFSSADEGAESDITHTGGCCHSSDILVLSEEVVALF